jgi:hypothetical protein
MVFKLQFTGVLVLLLLCLMSASAYGFASHWVGLRVGVQYDFGVSLPSGSGFHEIFGSNTHKGLFIKGGSVVIDGFFIHRTSTGLDFGIGAHPGIIYKGARLINLVADPETETILEKENTLEILGFRIPVLLKTRFSIFQLGMGIAYTMYLNGKYQQASGEVKPWDDPVFETWNDHSISFIVHLVGEIHPIERVPLFIQPGVSLDIHFGNESTYTETTHQLVNVVFCISALYKLLPFERIPKKDSTKE